MGLNSSDALPTDISFEDAYAAIRSWYQANVDRFASDPERGHFPARSKAYIESLPSPSEAAPSVIRQVLRHVIAGDLEWGYHESDGQFKMAAYAHAAFDAAGVDPFSD
jgi:hypothetical protein